MAKYRKIDPRIWNDEKFRALSHEAKLVFLFVLTHPNMTSLGAMRATVAGLAAELKLPVDAMSDAIGHACREGMLEADWDACFLGAPNFLKYNEPEGPNSVIKGWPAALDSIPECALKGKLIRRCIQYLEAQSPKFKDALPDAMWDAMRHAMSKACPIQEQEPEQEHTYIPADAGTASKPQEAKPQKSPATKAAKARKEPTGDHAEFIRYFTTAWEARQGTKYVMAAKDGVAAAKLLKDAAGGDLAKAQAIVDRYLACDDPFIAKQGHPLPLLLNQINRFTAGTSPARPSGSITKITMFGEV